MDGGVEKSVQDFSRKTWREGPRGRCWSVDENNIKMGVTYDMTEVLNYVLQNVKLAQTLSDS